ncbi:MAG: hypothetical protein R3E01_34640 [Pirellulaceae bacterium]
MSDSSFDAADHADQNGNRSWRTDSRKRTRWILATISGVGVALLIGAGTLPLWFAANRLPVLDRASFDAGTALWDRVGPADYSIETEVQGRQGATYKVEVRGGQAVAAWRNGAPLRDPRTWRTWSVPGMFDTIERDVEAVEAAAAGHPEPGRPQVAIRARMDPRWGYPADFQRIEIGTINEVRWHTVRFEVLTGGDGETGQSAAPQRDEGTSVRSGGSEPPLEQAD